jgi:hypothetical protein
MRSFCLLKQLEIISIVVSMRREGENCFDERSLDVVVAFVEASRSLFRLLPPLRRGENCFAEMSVLMW